MIGTPSKREIGTIDRNKTIVSDIIIYLAIFEIDLNENVQKNNVSSGKKEEKEMFSVIYTDNNTYVLKATAKLTTTHTTYVQFQPTVSRVFL